LAIGQTIPKKTSDRAVKEVFDVELLEAAMLIGSMIDNTIEPLRRSYSEVLHSSMRTITLIRRAAVLVLACTGALLVIVSVTPVLQWWTDALARPWENGGGDTLIVLGSDTSEDMVGEHSYWRCVYAVWAWRDGGFAQIVVSGPESMRTFIVASGVPADRIRLENRSANTRENALFTASLLAQTGGRKTLMTSDYHTFRAARAFRKAGLDVITQPVPDAGKRIATWRLRWAVLIDLLEETAKIGYYQARGWI
jgi:uncharacterized SAM-binding protein YcdF (DUF218 family)